jgi:fatty-acyl-CoA synthase
VELHPATLWEAIGDVVPDRTALVQGQVRRSWRDFADRSARVASVLLDHGVGPGSKVGLLLYNSPEFLEGYFAALKVRAVPFNVNYRYTADEVAYLLANADAQSLIYHSSLGPAVASAVATVGPLQLLLEVDDGGEGAPGAVRYEDALIAAEPAARIVRDPDDVTFAYTGGTTGMPKGVVSRVGPPLEYLLQTVPPLLGHGPVVVHDGPAFAAGLGSGEWLVSLPAPPLIHSTGLGIGVAPALATGGTVVFEPGRHFDPNELWDTVEAERVNSITVVGDPFARPMAAALDADPSRDLSCVRVISSSGAMFSTEIKRALLHHLPQAMILDIIASTEGSMGMAISTVDDPGRTGSFRPGPGVILVSPEGEPIAPGSGRSGLVAVPGGADGYFKDEARTATTFPMIDGQRYTIPGDHAVIEADGTMTLLGRGSSTINTAGEKVFPEEVEEVLKALPSVEDALVFGIDDEHFGQKVAAVISWNGAGQPLDEVIGAVRRKLAGYKVPRSIIVVEQVPRTQVGKPDYPSARVMFATLVEEDDGGS